LSQQTMKLAVIKVLMGCPFHPHRAWMADFPGSLGRPNTATPSISARGIILNSHMRNHLSWWPSKGGYHAQGEIECHWIAAAVGGRKGR
jgi:hypothetical protein